MAQVWGGRFSGDMDATMARFNTSLPFDRRLWEVDIIGSQAWARALARAGILDDEESERIVAGLEELRAGILADPEAAFASARTTRISTATSSGA